MAHGASSSSTPGGAHESRKGHGAPARRRDRCAVRFQRGWTPPPECQSLKTSRAEGARPSSRCGHASADRAKESAPRDPIGGRRCENQQALSALAPPAVVGFQQEELWIARPGSSTKARPASKWRCRRRSRPTERNPWPYPAGCLEPARRARRCDCDVQSAHPPGSPPVTWGGPRLRLPSSRLP